MTKRKLIRHSPSGAPNIGNRRSLKTPDASPTTMSRGMKYGNYLDGNVALQEIDHPSVQWAGIELQPVRPRERFDA
ncbi:hypothetical protein MITS9509_01363 [Synechococcus sp. MIT S9509]|uniref:hypothetical protein n=1 Tax=Synechococcus sp. MIT S9509 TaxID=1801630 RepID=UPI0007BAE513|nr:hypothetical protein [Synechococcus sp. MIT S9509]KZR92376.1 hypothetical protein MITS9509_01363 [Synechococcus sp. MIT S9509]